MRSLSATMALMSVLALTVAPVCADGQLPEPSSSRIIVHGVDCSIDHGTVCDDDRPVFDEAIASLPAMGAVVIRTQVTEGLGGEPASALPPTSADAVRGYLIDSGVTSEQVEVEGCTEMPGPFERSYPVDVQLSKSFE